MAPTRNAPRPHPRSDSDSDHVEASRSARQRRRNEIAELMETNRELRARIAQLEQQIPPPPPQPEQPPPPAPQQPPPLPQQNPRVVNEEELDRRLDRLMRYQPPKFYGEPDDRKAEQWLKSIEKTYRALRCDSYERVEFSVFLMENAASDWWRIIEAKWREEETPWIWDNFKKEFLAKYIPRVVKRAREKEFMELSQGNSTVNQYEAQFARLLPYASHFENDDERKAQKFIEGLKPDLQWELMSMRPTSYAQAVMDALDTETRMKDIRTLAARMDKRPILGLQTQPTFKPEFKPNFQDRPTGRQGQKAFQKLPFPKLADGPRLAPQEQAGCTFCGNPSHTVNMCWKRTGKCLGCGTTEHQVKDCPRKRFD